MTVVPCVSVVSFVAFVLVVSSVAPSSAQAPRFRTNVETVTVTVTVTDQRGRLIADLTRDDFDVFEEGTAVPVTQFTADRVPVSLGVLLDVSDSMRGEGIVEARGALDRFVGDLLDVEDEAFVATFNHLPAMLSPWKTPPSLLVHALDPVRPTGGTAMYDAIAAFAPQFSRRHNVRAALVVISDGADTASDKTLQQAREVIRRSDAFVYAIAVDARGGRASTRVNAEALRDITGPSGGYTEVVRDRADLGPATARIANELNHQYTLGYTSPRPPDGSWRSIRVRVRNHEYLARSRRGYYAERLPS